MASSKNKKKTKDKNYNLKRVKTAKNLRLHNHQVAFLRRSSQRFRQLGVLDSFEIHTGKNITNKGIKPLRVCKCQFGKRVDTDSLHHKASFHFGIYCVEGKEIRRLGEDDNFRIQLGEEQGIIRTQFSHAKSIRDHFSSCRHRLNTFL